MLENKNPIIINHFKLRDDLGQISAIDLLEEANIVEPNDDDFSIDLKEDTIFENENDSSIYKAKVIVTLLNVRNNFGFNNKIISQLKKDDICTIVEEQGNWGKLLDGDGWICLEYVKKID